MMFIELFSSLFRFLVEKIKDMPLEGKKGKGKTSKGELRVPKC
jgi:hypothetical protein